MNLSVEHVRPLCAIARGFAWRLGRRIPGRATVSASRGCFDSPAGPADFGLTGYVAADR